MVPTVYIALCLIWSSTWLAIKFAIDDVPPLTAAAARFWLAVIVLLGVCVVRRVKLPDRRTQLAIVGWGVIQIGFSYAAVYCAEVHLSSGMTSVLFAAFPFSVAIVSARVAGGERWRAGKVFGLICGMLGVAVVFLDQLAVASTTAAVAVIAVLLATVACGFSIVHIKRDHSHRNTLALTTCQLLGGAIALTAAAMVVEQPLQAHWTTASLLATAYLAIFGSAIAFFGYYWLLKHMEGTTVATITFVTPVLAIVLGWLILDEAVTPTLILGAVLVLTGVRSVAMSERASRPAPLWDASKASRHDQLERV